MEIAKEKIKELTDMFASYRQGGVLMEKGGKNWIQDAVNPEHKGYCTPMTKSTCTPRRKALAKTFKKHHGFHKKGEDGMRLNEGLSKMKDNVLEITTMKLISPWIK